MRLYIFNTVGPRLRELACGRRVRRVRRVIALLRRRYKMHNYALASTRPRAWGLLRRTAPSGAERARVARFAGVRRRRRPLLARAAAARRRTPYLRTT